VSAADTWADHVGIVGLGVMGSAMAGQLIALRPGQVFGFDLDPERLGSFVDAGGHATAGVPELAASCGTLIVSLPSRTAFESVVGELAASALPRTVVIETSTLPLDAKFDAHDVLSGIEVTLLDCPLSGTGQQARDGDLVAYVSGDEQATEQVWPVLAGFTRNVHRLGAFGNGTRMKLIANLLVAIHNVAAAEAMLLAERSGLDLLTVLTAVGDGAGTSRMFEVRGPMMAAQDFDPATMRVDTFAKDLEIIAAFAAVTRTPTPLFSAASVIYQAALAQGRASQDTAAVSGALHQLTAAVAKEDK